MFVRRITGMYLVNKNAQQIYDQTLYLWHLTVKRRPKCQPVQYFAISGLGFISTCTKGLWVVGCCTAGTWIKTWMLNVSLLFAYFESCDQNSGWNVFEFPPGRRKRSHDARRANEPIIIVIQKLVHISPPFISKTKRIKLGAHFLFFLTSSSIIFTSFPILYISNTHPRVFDSERR